MATYEALRDRALARVGLTGQTEAQTVAQAALEEAMKFVAFNVRVPSLVASATATAPASPELESNAITLGVGGFNITATYSTPDRLYVKKDSSATDYGVPYEFVEYNHYIDLKSIPGGIRSDLFSSATIDELYDRAYTITPSGKVWARPLAQNNVLTLFYRQVPAAYSGAATPEILPMFDYILVNAAELVLKEWLREPTEILDTWELYEAKLGKQVERYDRFLHGQRKRSHLKIHKSYRPY